MNTKKLFFSTLTMLLYLSVTAQQTVNYVAKFQTSAGVTMDSRIFDNGTNSGIGTNTPAVPFHSNVGVFRMTDPSVLTRFIQFSPTYAGLGSIPAGSLISGGSTVNGEGLSLIPTGGGQTGVKVGSYVYANSAWKSVWESKNEGIGVNPTLLLMKNGGNVGIGTATPQSTLDVVATNGYFRVDAADGEVDIASGNNGSSFIDFKGSANLSSDWRGRIMHDDASGFSFFTNASSNPMRLANNGKVYLGVTRIGVLEPNGVHSDALLGVDGKVLAKSFYVNTTTWADYVFDEHYDLPKLSEVERFYKANKHLPEIPSEKEVLENGINVGEMNTLLLKKIEEMTLYMVQMQKEIDALKKK